MPMGCKVLIQLIPTQAHHSKSANLADLDLFPTGFVRIPNIHHFLTLYLPDDRNLNSSIQVLINAIRADLDWKQWD